VGPVRGFFITRAADTAVRSRSQHGGTVTALVALALSEGLLDAAVLAKSGRGLLPAGVTILTAAEALRLGGSRFVVSPAIAEFNRAVQTDAQRIGIVATPCQALALAKMRAFPMHERQDGSEKLRLVIGLFCGWALSWRPLTGLLARKIDPAAIIGMDIPPSRYHSLEAYTQGDTLRVSLDEVTPCVREACRVCDDMTAEYADLSVGSARLPEGWEEARGWNQVLVRTARGMELLELARRLGVLEFRDVPGENLEKLKAASLGKKGAAAAAGEERRRQTAAKASD
jgi:coenzyme F420 hydrogenase subunit beta